MVDTCTTASTAPATPPPEGGATTPQAPSNAAPSNPVQQAAPMAAAYTNSIWFGSLPAATGFIAKTYAATSTATQKARAQAMHEFLWNPAEPLLHLNADGGKFTALLNIPQSNMVKVMHGIGVGASAIGSNAPTDGKLLMLAGEGDEQLGRPDVFCLPASLRQRVIIKCPTEAAFQANLQSGTNPTSWHRFLANDVPAGDMAEVMQLAVIPPFLVYDGFNGDVLAEEVYERVLNLDDQTPSWVQHAKDFLRACTVSHNAPDPKQHVDMLTFTTMAPREAKVWAKEKFEATYPLPTQAAAQNILFEQMLQQWQSQQTNMTQAQVETVVKPEDVVGMSSTELKKTMLMCGLESGDEESLPNWLKLCAEKGQTEETKDSIISQLLQSTKIFYDVDIPITAPLLKMIRLRKWLGGAPVPSSATAATGLSPFAVGPMSEEEVVAINEHLDAVSQATHTTTADIKASKLKAKTPADARDWLDTLKAYANLVHALFTIKSPHYIQVKEVINSINALKPEARKAMTAESRAAIMWIVLLQARNFAQGKTTVLSEFTTMQSTLAAKITNIMHAELPVALIATDSATVNRQPSTNRLLISERRTMESDSIITRYMKPFLKWSFALLLIHIPLWLIEGNIINVSLKGAFFRPSEGMYIADNLSNHKDNVTTDMTCNIATNTAYLHANNISLDSSTANTNHNSSNDNSHHENIHHMHTNNTSQSTNTSYKEHQDQNPKNHNDLSHFTKKTDFLGTSFYHGLWDFETQSIQIPNKQPEDKIKSLEILQNVLQQDDTHNGLQNRSCLTADVERTEDLVRSKVAVPRPIINLGMPKCGSSTLRDFFKCTGLNDHHGFGETGLCIADAVKRGEPPISGCTSTRGKESLTQLDSCHPERKPSEGCWYPQVSFLDEIHEELPNATFVMIFRPVDEWIRSARAWGNLVGRWSISTIPGAVQAGEILTDEELRNFLCGHVKHVREFVKQYSSHELIELDLYDTERSSRVMSSLFNADETCWGWSNKNENLP